MMTTTTTTTTTAVDIPGGLRRRTLITRTGRRREEEEEEEAGTDQQDIFLQNHVLEPIRTLLSSSASAATSVGQQQPQPQSRIIGGSDASAGEFPFVAEFELGCGGSLIAPSVILSVAHCHDIIVNGKFAYVGSNKLRNGIRREIDYVIEHPDYDDTNSRYDVLLVILKEPITTITPARLNGNPNIPGVLSVNKQNNKIAGRQPSNTNDTNDSNQVGELLTVVGFGVTKEGTNEMSDVLQKAQVPYVPQETCQEWYAGGSLVHEPTMFCAGYQRGQIDSCQGDSGSPILNQDGIQLGSVSWGAGCAQPKVSVPLCVCACFGIFVFV